MKHFIAGLVILAALGGCAGGRNYLPATSRAYTMDQDEITVRAILLAQASAWNRGDIASFMQGYWPDDRLRFASGGTVTRGWQAISDRYHERYKDKETMGTLSFSELEFDRISRTAIIVHGAWMLERTSDAPSGLFTLVFRKLDDGWVIVSDTTTSAQ